MNAVLKYPGAKNRIAAWIVSYFPEHSVYLEPFAGSAAVLLNKKPSRLETINDINDEIVNMFAVLRDPELCQLLCNQISLTPWARAEYDQARTVDDVPDCPVERARRYLVRSWQGISGGQRYATGWKHSVAPQGPVCSKAWDNFPSTIIECCDRLKNVQIENSDGIELIRKFNNPNTLIYIDPPYPHSTRKNYLYTHEMSDTQHMALLRAIADSKSMIMVSGYDCAMYDTALSGWWRVEKNTRAEAGQSRKEVLWMNYGPESVQMEVCES